MLPDKKRQPVFLPGKAKCVICGRGIADLDWRLYQTCDFWKCRVEHRRQQRTLQTKIDVHERRQREKFEKQVFRLRNKAASLLGIGRPEIFEPVVVPATERPLTPLPQERRSALSNHLKGLLSETQANPILVRDDGRGGTVPTDIPDVNANPLPIIQVACATCRGSCCNSGGDRAYLTGETILSYWKRYTELEPHEIRAAFLAYTAEDTVEDSCIFHGINGCCLPREARSATCNEFKCADLNRLPQKLSGPGPHPVFLMAVRKTQAVRYAFVCV